MKSSSQKSLYITLSIVSVFLLGIVSIVTAQKTEVMLTTTDNALAGTQEAVETTIPVVTTPSSPTPKATVKATTIATVKATATASPSAIPVATRIATAAPIVNTNTSPTPVPTFNLNLPGDTAPQGTVAPAAQTKQSNSTPIIIGVVAGILLIVGGVILFIVRRQQQNNEFIPPVTPAMPPQTPPQYSAPNPMGQSTSTENQVTTPYDQYVNNQQNQK